MKPGLAKIVRHAVVAAAVAMAVEATAAVAVGGAADVVVVIPIATNQNIEKCGVLWNRIPHPLVNARQELS